MGLPISHRCSVSLRICIPTSQTGVDGIVRDCINEGLYRSQRRVEIRNPEHHVISVDGRKLVVDIGHFSRFPVPVSFMGPLVSCGDSTPKSNVDDVPHPHFMRTSIDLS